MTEEIATLMNLEQCNGCRRCYTKEGMRNHRRDPRGCRPEREPQIVLLQQPQQPPQQQVQRRIPNQLEGQPTIQFAQEWEEANGDTMVGDMTLQEVKQYYYLLDNYRQTNFEDISKAAKMEFAKCIDTLSADCIREPTETCYTKLIIAPKIVIGYSVTDTRRRAALLLNGNLRQLFEELAPYKKRTTEREEEIMGDVMTQNQVERIDKYISQGKLKKAAK